MSEPAEKPEPEAAEAEPAAEIDPLKAAQAEAAKWKDQALRALAEMENTRKRTQRDLEESRKYAITGFARELVSVLENLQRASASIPEEARANEPIKNLAEGIDITLRELLAAFEKHGIKRIDPVGEKFDHNYHQAVVQVETKDAPPGTVVQVLQAGYVIHDRLLKPAMVAVSKEPAPTA